MGTTWQPLPWPGGAASSVRSGIRGTKLIEIDADESLRPDICVAVGATAALLLPTEAFLVTLLEYVQAIGLWGPFLFGVIYVLATVLMLPGAPLGLMAGFAFGVVVGTVTVSVASTVGATLAFLLGRTLARRWVESKVARRGTLRALDEAVGRRGLVIVLLTRLSPVFPYNLLNYTYGLTRVPLGTYVLGSWIGMLPGTVTYVYAGSALKSAAEVVAGKLPPNPARDLLLGVGVVATVVVMLLAGRMAREALRRAADGS